MRDIKDTLLFCWVSELQASNLSYSWLYPILTFEGPSIMLRNVIIFARMFYRQVCWNWHFLNSNDIFMHMNFSFGVGPLAVFLEVFFWGARTHAYTCLHIH